MANFNLGLAKCRLREIAESTDGRYFRYMMKNHISMKDKENIFVKKLEN